MPEAPQISFRAAEIAIGLLIAGTAVAGTLFAAELASVFVEDEAAAVAGVAGGALAAYLAYFFLVNYTEANGDTVAGAFVEE